VNVAGLVAEAVALHQAGRVAEATAGYERVLEQIPNHFDATHLLGVIALQEGRLDAAEDFITRALRLKPKDWSALNNLGMVYLRRRNLELAQVQFERASKADPKSVDALANLGTVLRESGRPRDALVPLNKAHAIAPRSSTVCNLLGACLLDLGDARHAVQMFEAATRAAPQDADGWGNLAVALNRIGEHDRAQAAADKAVEMCPDSATALAARAAVEFERGQVEAAIVTYEEAIELAEPSVQTVTALANALWTSGRCDEAMEQLRRATLIDGQNVMARWKLAISHCQPFYEAADAIQPSRDAFVRALDELQAWFRAAPRPEAYLAVGSTQPFFLAYQPFNNRELLRRHGDLCSEWMASMPRKASPSRGAALAGRKLRIGIASAHIRDHSVWNAITKGWVQYLDRNRFEIFLFRLGRDSDAETARAKLEVAHFEEGPSTVQGWAEAISEACLDALIYPEIGMDALTTQLAALRLAPVQAASWGHAETTGLPTIDLYLSAELLEPAQAEDNYRETLVRLPNLGVCVQPLTPTAVTPDLRALGLPDDEPLLLCPGTPFKYSPLYDALWARIARGLTVHGKSGWARIADRVRGRKFGRLVFFRSGNATMDLLVMQRLRRAFDREKVDFDAHVCLIPHLDRAQFFGLMQQSALMLDTAGFSGFNNALQAVEAGLPLLAHEGQFMRGRLASGIMRRLDLPELVATSDEEFIERAVALAGDPSRRAQLKSDLTARRSLLFDDLAPVRALERCLTEAIAGTCRQT
jgi:predicted O-linked N-acetylglucosamine transferase (SPINDLY family)